MISASLNVERHKIHSETLVPGLEQMIGDFFTEDVVVALSRLSCQTNQEPIKMTNQRTLLQSINQWEASIHLSR